ncbi:hypothetical protein CIHG_01478 [Coccidioides immitis H538.4]|uniref:Uncharacterized protein n=3 Tax=Coccidioides immitis TaxID=5501 RepID=A0A0J8QP28_COCIT|nr:hypothetical protein CIRG_01328 [Coccidioides immitis RMSCC 2394]KMU74226.1 hypothetical protein CISG_04576 [Coccidioides immitis RMSCC 3703]KMU83695.1 hypothetical protein CIHG_01478 [Coccidioides immitis H538.4]
MAETGPTPHSPPNLERRSTSRCKIARDWRRRTSGYCVFTCTRLCSFFTYKLSLLDIKYIHLSQAFRGVQEGYTEPNSNKGCCRARRAASHVQTTSQSMQTKPEEYSPKGTTWGNKDES